MTHLTKIIAINLLLLLASGSAMGAAPSCYDIMSQLSPCVSYLLQNEAKPPQACCAGVNVLAKYSKDKRARRDICGCIKTAANMMGIINYNLISSLPQTCGVCVNLPPISNDINCSKA